MPEKQKILITGATGYIGRRLLEKLLEKKKYAIRLLVRDRQKVQVAVMDQVEIVEGDTFRKEELASAVAGIDCAFYLIHSMGNTKDYARLDRESAENFRDACIAAKVKRIIYLGGLGVKSSASEHLLSRIETGEVLSAQPHRIQTIWIRAGVIIGSGSASFEIIRNLCEKLPIMVTPRWVRTRTQPVGVDDVIAYLSQSVELDYRKDLTVDIGSSPISFQEMMEKAARIMGLKRYLQPVPVLSPRLSAYWLILFTPLPYRLAMALVEGLKSETLVQNDNAAVYFPRISPLPFEDAVRCALLEQEKRQIVSRWCDSGSGETCDIRDFDIPGSVIFRDVRTMQFPKDQTSSKVFENVCSVGGENGWFRYNFLWRLRGILDKMFGGYGLSRGRRLEKALRVGDALDFWRVADLKEGKRLLLYAQMKLPGKAWIEFDVQDRHLVQTAHFIPRGILGRLYWYSLIPIHYFVFTNLARSLVTKYD